MQLIKRSVGEAILNTGPSVTNVPCIPVQRITEDMSQFLFQSLQMSYVKNFQNMGQGNLLEKGIFKKCWQWDTLKTVGTTL